VKIALISLTEDVFIPSLRYLSAYLRAQGHETKVIYLPWGRTDNALHSANSFRYPYPQPVLEQIVEICKDSDLLGLSLMTCHFDHAVHITRFLREHLSAPIIWGGIHPTIRPLECLKYADMACVGEGELSVSQLAREMDAGKAWESLTVPGF
jgi:anaerobic magnesium-protoporphyrin IX monomethyl ester cyclase